MDISSTIEADSTQVNADDLTGSPRTVTITGVSKGTADQPVNIELAEFPGRSYRPCKSMRRVLVLAWGKDASVYVGRRMTLFNDQSVKWGGQEVGGVRIKALSHIGQRITLALTVTRGKRAPYVVEPLPDAPAAITAADAADFERRIADASTIQDLDAIGRDLKARDLGSHRGHLQSAWADRRKVIKEPSDIPPKPIQENVTPDTSEIDAPASENDAAAMATPAQLKRLNAIRQAEKWEADDEWHAYVQALTGTEVAADGQLTEAQAQAVIDEFGADQ